jgi:tRNA A-37 threonylcarbamoyl transferase component Bud32
VTSTQPDTNSGELIGGGRYRLGEVIGSGGMATVHRGHDLLLDRDVAVKVFREDIAEASDSRRVEGEMKLLGSINHPGLVTLHDAALSDDGSTAYLVMELVEGEHLAALLSRGELSPGDTTAVVAQVAGALAHIHAKGIVHRDVKPANILVRRDDEGAVHAKLADLGIARMADSTHLTNAGSILGTVAYLSPEQVTGGAIGPAVDVYALGLVLLEALTGERRFTGTPAEQAAARTVTEPTIPDSVPTELAALARAMTRLDPASRIDAAEVERSLIAGVPDTGSTRIMPTFGDLDATAANPVQTAGAAPGVAAAAGAMPGSMSGPTEATELIDAGARARSADEPTVVLHGAPVPEPTEALDGAAVDRAAVDTAALDTARASRAESRRGRGPTIVLVVVVVLIVVAIGIAIAVGLAQPDAPNPPDYPAVDGKLGDLLDELQRSVQP